MLALKAGVDPSKIVFSGVGKTNQEINFAIEKKYCLLMLSQKVKFKKLTELQSKKKK